MKLELFEATNLRKLTGNYGYPLLKRAREDWAASEIWRDDNDSSAKHPNYDKEFFQKWAFQLVEIIASFDPTQDKLYVKWLIERYLDSGIRNWHDFDRAGEALRLFHQYKRRLPQKDINVYKTLTELEDILLHFYETSKDKIKEKDLGDGDRKVIYDDNELKIVIPKTEKASCFYGRNTRWCTAGTGAARNYFKDYAKDGRILYIILLKKENRRFQFCFESMEFRDERDDPVNPIQIGLLVPKIGEIFEKLGKIKPYKDSVWRFETRVNGQTHINFFNSNFERHRLDGPAMLYQVEDEVFWAWYKDGALHRDDNKPVMFDGGAIYYSDNYQSSRSNKLDDMIVTINSDGRVNFVPPFNNLKEVLDNRSDLNPLTKMKLRMQHRKRQANGYYVNLYKKFKDDWKNYPY